MIKAISRLESEAKRRTPIAKGIQPHLVFKVPIASGTSPIGLTEKAQDIGVTVVSVESDGAIIAFRDDTDLSDFKNAVVVYQRGPATGINPQTNAPFKGTRYDIFEIIEADEMKLWGRADRIGARLAKLIGTQGEAIADKELYVLDVELWHRGRNELAQESVDELQCLLGDKMEPGEKLSDFFIGDMICLARVTVTGEKLSRLLELDSVAEAEIPPQPIIDSIKVSETTHRSFPPPPRPDFDGPRVCILDSGITSGHRLLANNVGHEEAVLTTTTSPADSNGHGTMVGGIAVFGSVRACYESGRFASPVTLFSARVLNDENRFDEDKNIITQMRDAIKTFVAAPYNCRVFNLSLGSPEPLITSSNKRQGLWAEALDHIAREFKVLLVVSAGNHNAPYDRLTSDAEADLVGYPEYLFEPGARLCDPATAAIPITVGALAEDDRPALRHGVSKEWLVRPIARANEPTPSTRIGPGINNATKPEFVSYGGNVLFDGYRQQRVTNQKDHGLAVMSLCHEHTKQLFSFNVGTSFAAPRIAHLASLVWDRIRRDFGDDPHPNLVRAVLATSAVLPAATSDLITTKKGKEFIPHVCGYGMPDESLALESGDRRVTLVAQGRITVDKFQLFQIPVPREFQEDRDTKRVIVSLAYDPPVRRRRTQYLGLSMCSYLIRNRSVEDIIESYRAITTEERRTRAYRSSIQGADNCNLTPSPTSLKTSTLQRYEWVTKRGFQANETFYLLVRAERNWVSSGSFEQDFAVAVTLESNNPRLYAAVRERIPVRQRTRLRS